MSPNRKQKIVFYVSIVWVLVIFSNSLLPGDLSSAQSGFVVNMVKGFFSIFGVSFNEDVLSSLIRSLAHLTEFGILGFLWMLYISGFEKERGYVIVWVSGFGIALLDEIIQIVVPGRAFQLSDLLIDLSGIILGSLIVIIFPFIGKSLVETKKS
jgi:VanZ family protein